MKKFSFLTMIVFFSLATVGAADLKNVTRSLINARLASGGTIAIRPGETVNVSDKEMQSADLQRLIQRGDVVIVNAKKKKEDEGKGKEKRKEK